MLLAAGCNGSKPDPPTPKAAIGVTVSDARTKLALEAVSVTLHTGEHGWTNADGYVVFQDLILGERGITLVKPGYTSGFAEAKPFTKNMDVVVALEPLATPRPGLVRLNGNAFADDEGTWLPRGATLFWGIWGMRHDRIRTIQNLDWLYEHGIDYVRVLAQVGGPSWEDRAVNPTDPTWTADVVDFIDTAYAHGLRTQVTIFGSAKLLSGDQRRSAVENVMALLPRREHKVFLIEVANESFQNGPSNEEVRSLGRRLQNAPILVALSSGSSCADRQALYAGGVGDVGTHHLDRTISTPEREWRHVRQAWDVIQFCDGIPRAGTDNEPISPVSSVARDRDPLRLAMHCAVSYLSHLGACVYHGSVRGGGVGDVPAAPRPANYWEVVNAEPTLKMLGWLVSVLPADLANWAPQNTNNNFPARPFDRTDDPDGNPALSRAYCANAGDRFVCLPSGVLRATALRAKRRMAVTVYDPMTGLAQSAQQLEAGQLLPLDETPPAYVVTGQFN